jgi:hypothetical protein
MGKPRVAQTAPAKQAPKPTLKLAGTLPPQNALESAINTADIWRTEISNLITALSEMEYEYCVFSSDKVEAAVRRAIVDNLEKARDHQTEDFHELLECMKAVAPAAGGAR